MKTTATRVAKPAKPSRVAARKTVARAPATSPAPAPLRKRVLPLMSEGVILDMRAVLR